MIVLQETRSSFSDVSELDVLQSSINQSIDAIRAEISSQGLPELSNYAQKPHPLDDPNYLSSPRLYEARRLALASIGQLKTLLQIPYEKVVEAGCAVYDTACLDIFVQTGILDALAEPRNHDSGLHVLNLHTELDMDVFKLTAILRYLASQGWVYEKSQNVFALMRPALELCHGRNGRKWSLTPGKPRIAQSLKDLLTHPEWRYSTSALETAFQLSHKTKLSVFSYLNENPAELKQWASAIRSFGDVYQFAVVNDYPWKKLGPRTIFDCGGGQGNLSICLASILPESHFVIQDLPQVVPIAQMNIERDIPAAAKEGRVIAEVHSFFEPQPRVVEGGVFIFRYILHNWPDTDCILILRNTMKSMDRESKILIIEGISIPSTVATSNDSDQSSTTLDDLQSVNEYRQITPPNYIPANFGSNDKMSQALGIHMLGLFNAKERCLSEWQDIIFKAGLVISQVYVLRANVSVIECELSTV